MAPLRSLPPRSIFLVPIMILLSVGILAGCVTNSVTVPKPPAAQDPFAGLPITKPADETPLEDVTIGKGQQSPKVGLLLSANTKAAQRYADMYWDILARSTGAVAHVDSKKSDSFAVTPVLDAIEQAFEGAIQLEKWEEAKTAGVDLVALVNLTCHLPVLPFDSASYSVQIYMLTPDGQLLSVIKASTTEQSYVPRQMLSAGMMGRAIDNAQGGYAKAFGTYEQKFMNDALMQSGQGQMILRAAGAVSQTIERKLHDFLEAMDEARAFVNMRKDRIQPR